MKSTLYIVATLIEHYDQPPTVSHQLYANFADAKNAMRTEIEERMANFTADTRKVILDFDTVYEWYDKDGNGLTVTIEEMNVK